ncbi:MAG: DUF2270 domain-containing protein [Desulfobacteraceae bacterium]|nr:MAG: DUF2270 domain-containing protein [Desulfobacteraceae bacterium]
MPDESNPKPGVSEPVWTYRGYELKASEFTTAMVHFFRGEVARANTWRIRLDTTTNWAVLTTGAVVSFAFTQGESSHLVILLDLILVTFFLLIEARRYRYYELWSYRVRLMETDFFAPMLVPPFHPSPEWSDALAESLLHPQFPISEWEALGRRIRRNYLWIYIVNGISWLAKLGLFPVPAVSLAEFIERAGIGGIGGGWIVSSVGTFFIALLVAAVATSALRQTAGEVLPRYGLAREFLHGLGKAGTGAGAWFRPTRKRQQELLFIITEHSDRIARRILNDLNRGVTSLQGTGMYTHEPRAVLMCAMTVTEIPHLKALIAEEDPKAFVVVSPVQEIIGLGFGSWKKD